MRRFHDRDGGVWDVILGRESWGTLVALFVPVRGEGPVRQAALSATAQELAVQELDGMAEQELQSLLDGSTLKEEGQP